jgi:hypothetical protein
MNNKSTPVAGNGDEQTIKILLAESYPSRALSAEFRERVAAQVVQHRLESRERLRKRQMRFRFGTLAAVFGVCLLSVLIWPRWSAAKVLQRMAVAIEDARNAHIISWEFDTNGKRTKRTEGWYQGNKVRQEETDLSTDTPRVSGVQLFADGKYWTYQPQNNRVTRRLKEGFATYNSSGFSIGAMQRDFKRRGWTGQVHILEEMVIEGRLTRRVSIEKEEPAGETRHILLVDPRTDLPYRAEFQLKTTAGWTTRGIAEMRYNEPLDSATIFTPDFPKTASWIDEDAERTHLKERLARGIAEKRAGSGRRIVLRDFQVNDEGDVFLLYSAGKRPEDAFFASQRFAGRDW